MTLPETSTTDRVKAARTPRDAILILAGAVDALEQRVAQLEAAGSWGDWATPEESIKPPPPRWDSHEEHVEAQRTLAELAAEIVSRPRDQWTEEETQVFQAYERETLERLGQQAAQQQSLRASNSLTVELRPPSPEKMERRRMFERQQLKLAMALGDDTSDWTEAYAKGGPVWLHAANRELVMSYPEPVRRAMVEDVIEDDPQAAHLMGIDILKQAAGAPDLEGGAGALAVGTIGGRK